MSEQNNESADPGPGDVDPASALGGVIGSTAAVQEHLKVLEYCRVKGLHQDSEPLVMLWSLKTMNAYLAEVTDVFRALEKSKFGLVEGIAKLDATFASYTAKLEAKADTKSRQIESDLNDIAVSINTSLGGFRHIADSLKEIARATKAAEQSLARIKRSDLIMTIDMQLELERMMRIVSDNLKDFVGHQVIAIRQACFDQFTVYVREATLKAIGWILSIMGVGFVTMLLAIGYLIWKVGT
jgi:hypothetical protein